MNKIYHDNKMQILNDILYMNVFYRNIDRLNRFKLNNLLKHLVIPELGVCPVPEIADPPAGGRQPRPLAPGQQRLIVHQVEPRPAPHHLGNVFKI